MTEVIYPWPHSALNPNSRPHWAEKYRQSKTYKGQSWALTKEAKAKGTKLDVTFRPADKRRRDLDNMIASCKAMFDGISLAIGVDDSKFEMTFRVGNPMPGGGVIVKFHE